MAFTRFGGAELNAVDGVVVDGPDEPAAAGVVSLAVTCVPTRACVGGWRVNFARPPGPMKALSWPPGRTVNFARPAETVRLRLCWLCLNSTYVTASSPAPAARNT